MKATEVQRYIASKFLTNVGDQKWSRSRDWSRVERPDLLLPVLYHKTD